MAFREWIHGGVTLEGLTLEGGTRAATLPRRFFYYFRSDGVLRTVGDTQLAAIGCARTGDVVAIDGATGHVVLVRQGTTEIASVINASLDAFVAFLGLCEDRYPYYTEEGDLDESVEIANSLRSELRDIDSGALREGSYWSDFLSDVAMGDYA